MKPTKYDYVIASHALRLGDICYGEDEILEAVAQAIADERAACAELVKNKYEALIETHCAINWPPDEFEWDKPLRELQTEILVRTE